MEAFVVACVAPAVIFAIWTMSVRTFIPAFLVALAHALFLGLPLFLLLRWKHLVNAATTMLGAFIIGCIPMAIWSLDVSDSELITAEIFGAQGWVSYATGVLIAGALGLAAGIVFWFYLRFRNSKR